MYRDSLNRESELQYSLRRLKDGLVSSALRSQVAVKLVNDDNSTIQELRKDTEDARLLDAFLYELQATHLNQA